MILKHRVLVGILAVVGGGTGVARAGDLAPPGPPAPTMHTLEEIYNRIEGLAAEVSVLRQQNTRLEEQLGDLYAYEGLPGWDVSVVATDVSAGFQGVPLAFAPGGHPSICYQDDSRLMLARFNGTAWAVERVDETRFVGGYHSHAYHPSGHPAVAYQDGTSLNLRYAIHDGTSWQHTLLDAADNVGEYASLAFDSRGYGVIAYNDWTHGALKLARQSKVGGLIKWQIEAVDTNRNLGAYCQLALDPAGDPVISTIDRDTGQMVLMMQDASGGWGLSYLTSLRIGGEPSLAIRPDGIMGVLYKLFSADEVTLRTYPALGTYTIPVDGGSFQIAFAPNGQPAVALRDAEESSLKYASLVGQQWSIERVGDFGLVPTTLSLAFAPDGRPAISMFDSRRRQILYAIRAAPPGE